MKTMKWKLKLLAALALVASVAVIQSCKDDEDPTPLTISSLMANDKDLNGATSATDVATGAVITTEFSTDIDASTANDNSVVLTRTYNNTAVAKTIVVTGNKITVTPTTPLFAGDQYKISFTGDLKSSQGMALTAIDRSFNTAGVGLGTAPQASAQTLYVQFSNDIVDLTGNASKASSTIAFGNDRFGNANSAGSFNGGTGAGTGQIAELSGTKFISPSMTISVWVYINQSDYVAPGNRPLLGLAGNNGYWVEIGDGDTNPNWLKIGTNHKVSPDPQSHVYATAWGDFSKTDDGKDVNTLTKTGWHHLVMTFDAATYTKTDYWDGAKIKTFNLLDAGGEWNLKDMMLNNLTGVDGKLALGTFASKANTNPDWAMYSNAPRSFKGLMDDLRIFTVALSASEVTSLYTAEKVK